MKLEKFIFLTGWKALEPFTIVASQNSNEQNIYKNFSLRVLRRLPQYFLFGQNFLRTHSRLLGFVIKENASCPQAHVLFIDLLSLPNRRAGSIQLCDDPARH